MRRIAFILSYTCLGLYIAWDNTVLFPSHYFSAPQTISPKQVEDEVHYDLQFIQASYSENPNIQEQLVAENLFLVNNDSMFIPFTRLANKRFFLMTLGPELKTFEEYLGNYAPILTDEIVSVAEANLNYLGYYDPVIFAVNQSLEGDTLTASFIEKLSSRTRVVLVNFQDAEELNGLSLPKQVLQVQGASSMNQSLAAQALFGGVSAQGNIALQRNNQSDTVEIKTPVIRLSYGVPEMRGIPSQKLAIIDSIISHGIADSAMPGCQVLIAKDNMVIYNKAFGYHTYAKGNKVEKEDVYDLASVTKVAATTMASMRLFEEERLNLDLPLYNYFSYQLLPEPVRVWDTVSYADFLIEWEASAVPMIIPAEDTIRYQDTLMIVAKWESIGEPKIPALFQLTSRDLLTHTSGLPPSLSISGFYAFAKRSGYYNYAKRAISPYFAGYSPSMDRMIWQSTLQTPRGPEGYMYSDVNLMIMRRLIDSLSNQSFAQYLKDYFYQDLGLQYTHFNPQEQFKLKQIVPTEYNPKLDTLIHGVVHDPVAALQGGVAGHAGLFANANDLGILFQMLLNQGSYGGVQFFEPETVEEFTSRQAYSRGLGFDKPPLNRGYILARSASENSYGHTGFTGTCVWADPDNGLVYIFLSNRIHPNIKNHKISSLRIRERVHQAVYDALGIPPRQYKRKPAQYPQFFTRVAPKDAEVITSVEIEEAR